VALCQRAQVVALVDLQHIGLELDVVHAAGEVDAVVREEMRVALRVLARLAASARSSHGRRIASAFSRPSCSERRDSRARRQVDCFVGAGEARPTSSALIGSSLGERGEAGDVGRFELRHELAQLVLCLDVRVLRFCTWQLGAAIREHCLARLGQRLALSFNRDSRIDKAEARSLLSRHRAAAGVVEAIGQPSRTGRRPGTPARGRSPLPP